MTILGPRSLDGERMDESWSDPRDLGRTLARIARVNDRLGGTRAVRKALRRSVGGASGLHLLDVGTGDASLPIRILEWARAEGSPSTVVGLDPHPQIAEVARDSARTHPGLQVVRGDGRSLPFPDRSFDVALATLTLHHLDGEGVLAVLSEMSRVSRQLVLVNDLERSLPNFLGARFLAATLWRGDRVMRHDGPLSVLRSFTRRELHRAGREAGLTSVCVRRHFPYRLVLTGRPAS